MRCRFFFLSRTIDEEYVTMMAMTVTASTQRLCLLMAYACAARWTVNGFVVASRPSPRALFRRTITKMADAPQNTDIVSMPMQQNQQPVQPTSSSVGQADIGRSLMSEESNNNQQLAEQGLSWRSLIEVSSNRSRKIRGSNYVQLATVDPSTKEPRCRTVVFRGFLQLPRDHACAVHCGELSCVAKMITDLRSLKVAQISQQESATAEMVWWFPKTSEQYRILGRIMLIGSGQFPMDNDQTLKVARKEMWGNISDSARESFLTTTVPGDDYQEETTVIPKGGRDEQGKVVPVPDNFLLMLLMPREVDYLRLTNMYRQVDKIDDGQWSFRRVVP